jgi:ribonuclease HI
MYFDGSLNIDGAGAGVLFISPNKDKLRYVLRLYFPVSNNTAEYKACLHGIRIAVELGVKRLYVYGDSALVINQLNKDWDTTSEKMDTYCKEIRKLEGKFYDIEYSHVVRDKNKAADELSKLGSSRAKVPHGVFVQDLVNPSIKEEEDHMVEKPPD